jgi:hypothetical protein
MFFAGWGRENCFCITPLIKRVQPQLQFVHQLPTHVVRAGVAPADHAAAGRAAFRFSLIVQGTAVRTRITCELRPTIGAMFLGDCYDRAGRHFNRND